MFPRVTVLGSFRLPTSLLAYAVGNRFPYSAWMVLRPFQRRYGSCSVVPHHQGRLLIPHSRGQVRPCLGPRPQVARFLPSCFVRSSGVFSAHLRLWVLEVEARIGFAMSESAHEVAEDPVDALRVELRRLTNAVSHLERSNRELAEANAQGEDLEYVRAIQENVDVIAGMRQQVRVRLGGVVGVEWFHQNKLTWTESIRWNACKSRWQEPK